MDSQNLSIKFLNFEKIYEKLSDFTLKQAVNLTLLSDQELDKLIKKFLEFQKNSFEYINYAYHEIDENYPFCMQNCLFIIITILGTIFVIILGCTIWCFKYGTATDKIRYFFILCM